VSHLLVKVFMAGSKVMLECLEVCQMFFMCLCYHLLDVLDFLLKWLDILMEDLC